MQEKMIAEHQVASHDFDETNFASHSIGGCLKISTSLAYINNTNISMPVISSADKMSKCHIQLIQGYCNLFTEHISLQKFGTWLFGVSYGTHINQNQSIKTEFSLACYKN